MEKAGPDNGSRVSLNYPHWFLMGGRLERPQGEDLIGGCGGRRGRRTRVWHCFWGLGDVYVVMLRAI